MQKIGRVVIKRIVIKRDVRNAGYSAGLKYPWLWFRLWPDVTVIWHRETGVVEAIYPHDLYDSRWTAWQRANAADYAAKRRAAVLNGIELDAPTDPDVLAEIDQQE